MIPASEEELGQQSPESSGTHLQPKETPAGQEQLSVLGKPKVFALKYRYTEIVHRDTGCLKLTFSKKLYSKQLIVLSGFKSGYSMLSQVSKEECTGQSLHVGRTCCVVLRGCPEGTLPLHHCTKRSVQRPATNQGSGLTQYIWPILNKQNI